MHIVIEHLQNDTKLIVAFLLYIVDEKCLCCCCCLVALSLQNGYTHRFIRTLYLTKIGFSSIWQLAGSSFRYVVQCVHEGINFDRLKAIDGDFRKNKISQFLLLSSFDSLARILFVVVYFECFLRVALRTNIFIDGDEKAL